MNIRSYDPKSEKLILILLVSTFFLEKLAIPGTNGGLSLRIPALASIVMIGVVTGRLAVEVSNAIAVLLAASALIVLSSFSPALTFSTPALLLAIMFLMPYALRLRPNAVRFPIPFRYFNNIAALLAALGILQFVAQFLVGAEAAFFLDFNLPDSIMMRGYNNLNELRPGIFKSNGVFLLEASGLNQTLSLAILLELIYFKRYSFITLYVIGIVVTYSGTGLLMLAVLLPLWMLYYREWKLLAPAILLVAAIAPLYQVLNLDVFLARVGEFSSPTSSGYARFISSFVLLDKYILGDTLTLLVGRGPGSIQENFLTVGVVAFDPSWSKLVYEYGLIGFLSYALCLGFCMFREPRSHLITIALLLQFMFLGGFIATPALHMLILALLVWPTTSNIPVSGHNHVRLSELKAARAEP